MADAALVLPVAQGEAWEVLRWIAYGILLLPLFSFLINGLWLGRKSAKASAWTATLLMGGTLVLALALAHGYFREVLAHPDLHPGRTALAWEHVWMAFDLDTGSFAAKIGFMLDPISVMMIVVIALISFLVNVYSIGYMEGDPGAGRFFPTLSFFSFSMLGLVAASNLAQTFLFWELVGAASYLLIGFWYTKPSAVAASKKAFILTRLADAFFLMGLLIAGHTAGSFDFTALNSPAAAAAMNHRVGAGLFSANLLTLATLCVYMGAWGKSAMFPFHVWLPDAMEGPTPVSSLIHSATMVVAGVFLTARLYPLFSAADSTLRVVEATGAFTAVFAAAIACAQTDLKRILAYSTLSQLGLMMASLGAESYSPSMFHVFTHAFFKCLLFLSAGVIIHAIHSNDVREAGGLRKSLPRTYWATLIAVLAIAGIFPFAGFFSKESMLHAALAEGHFAVFAATLATGALTAFYMSRYFFLVFHGKKKPRPEAHEGLLMTLPILVLAIPSILAGWLGEGLFMRAVKPWSPGGANLEAVNGHGTPWLPLIATLLAVAGIAASAYWYAVKGNRPGFPDRLAPGWYRALAAKFWIDEIWMFLAKGVGARAIAKPLAWLELRVMNGAFDSAAGFLKRLAFVQSLAHSGQVQWYIAVALAGLFLLAAATGTGS